MNKIVTNNIKLFLRYMKESHCLNIYYNDFIINGDKSKHRVLDRLCDFPTHSSEDFIGLSTIFSVWLYNVSKKTFWLIHYEAIKSFEAKKLIIDTDIYRIKKAD